jgi:cholera toxin transcriptional activator
MGMIQIDNAADAPAEPRAAKSMENLTCLTIRTGNADCIARFYPALYQLTLIKAGEEEKVDLGFSGSRLLERLVRNPGEVVDRDELMSHAWSGRVVGQGSLNQQIYTLRQILADESERNIIQTLPRRGYLLNPNYVDISLESVTAEAPQARVEPPAIQARIAAPASRDSVNTWRLPAILASTTSLLLFGVILLWNHTSMPSPAPVATQLLTLTYAPQTPEELAGLMTFGEDLSHRLVPQLKEHLQVVVGLHENTLDLVCLRADGSARTLHIHQSHVSDLVDADLASCLP